MRRNVLYNPRLRMAAKKLRNEMTAAEKKIWYEYLKDHNFRFLRQKPIGNYIVDFYSPRLRLIIEIDGETHLDDKSKIYDDIRTKFFTCTGLKVLRFWNDDVINGVHVVGEIINKEIDKLRTLNPPNPLC